MRRVHVGHIGTRTLERLLYALDPTESNEAIVKQRDLLRMGTPRWLLLEIRYGNLSVTGEVEAKGVRATLPKIERLSLAGLPIYKRLEGVFRGMGQVIDLLNVLNANTLILEPGGAVRFGP